MTTTIATSNTITPEILRDLILRSVDLGDGWRKVSDTLWNLVVDQNLNGFELDHYKQWIRIKPTPEDLMNQIKAWKLEAEAELRKHDRLQEAKVEARNLFE